MIESMFFAQWGGAVKEFVMYSYIVEGSIVWIQQYGGGLV